MRLALERGTSSASPERVSSPTPRASDSNASRLLRIAWLAILVGVALEILMVAVASAQGESFVLAKRIASGLRGVTWSSLVCVAIGWAQGLQPLSSVRTGFVGLLSAPLAVVAARALHKEALVLLDQTPPATDAFHPLWPLCLRAVEYLLFGWWIANVSKARTDAKSHVKVGATIGVGATIAQFVQPALAGGSTPAFDAFVPTALNELVFPIGCSLVLYGSARKSRAAAASAEAK